MSDWGLYLPAFLAAAVEWVEAFTIVLAVSLSIGWARAAGAAAAALALLGVMTAVTGGVLRLGLGLVWLQGAIGVFLLLFGARWLAKAVARQAGLKARHDEAAEFAATRAALARGERGAAWLIAFKGVLLEGLEVWMIVVSLGVKAQHPLGVAAAAGRALLAVVAAGDVLQAPFHRVPENAIKFVVGAMILAGGTFWTHEALGGLAAWPIGDWSLPALFLFYLLGGFGLAAWWRRHPLGNPAA